MRYGRKTQNENFKAADKRVRRFLLCAELLLSEENRGNVLSRLRDKSRKSIIKIVTRPAVLPGFRASCSGETLQTISALPAQKKSAGRKAPRKSYCKQLAALTVYLRPFEKVLAAGHCLPFITSASRSARLVIMPSTPRSSKRHISSGSSTVHGVSSIPWPFISATSSGVSIR
jgi:hypothetical protein